MSVEYTLSCPFGGFPSIRYNELRDITAAFLSEVLSLPWRIQISFTRATKFN